MKYYRLGQLSLKTVLIRHQNGLCKFLNQDSNEIIAEISQNTQLAKQYIQATHEFKNGLDADEQAELISDTVLPTYASYSLSILG